MFTKLKRYFNKLISPKYLPTPNGKQEALDYCIYDEKQNISFTFDGIHLGSVRIDDAVTSVYLTVGHRYLVTRTRWDKECMKTNTNVTLYNAQIDVLKAIPSILHDKVRTGKETYIK